RSDRQGIGAGTHDTLVPMLLHAELLQGNSIDVLFDLPFGPTGPDEFTPFDLVEERFRAPFGGDQRIAPHGGYLFLLQGKASRSSYKVSSALALDDNSSRQRG